MTVQTATGSADGVRNDLVAHFRQNREPLRQQWLRQMTAKGFLSGLSSEETQSESATIYDTCIECLASGQYEGAQKYARTMAERGVLRRMTTEQIVGIFATLRDVFGRSLSEFHQQNIARLNAALDVYEPVANKILSIVTMAFIEGREKIVRQQQEAIRELSTPVLQLREGLLILPVVGMIDTQRARQLTEQLLRAIRAARARVVVLDITGVAAVDSKVANHLLQTVEAARLMGANVIVTGLSPEVAQTLVEIGVDLGKINTMADLQSGIEEADRIVGYKVTKSQE